MTGLAFREPYARPGKPIQTVTLLEHPLQRRARSDGWPDLGLTMLRGLY
jgi:hypothetical protein